MTCDDPFHTTCHVHACSYLSSTTADEIAGLKRLNQTALYVGVCRCLELGAHLTTHTRHKLATSKAAAALAQDKVDDLSKQLAELQSRTTSRISELEVEAANNASEATSLREQLARANDRTAQLQRERDDAAAATSTVEKDLRQLQQRSEEQRSALETELREAREACTVAETVRGTIRWWWMCWVFCVITVGGCVAAGAVQCRATGQNHARRARRLAPAARTRHPRAASGHGCTEGVERTQSRTPCRRAAGRNGSC